MALRGDTLDSRSEPGRALSRDIAKIMLTAPVWFASTATNTAATAQSSRMSPNTSPAADLMTYARPPLTICGSSRSVSDMNATRNSSAPKMPEHASARRMPVGQARRGSIVSSPTDPAVSNPHMTVRPTRRQTSRAPR